VLCNTVMWSQRLQLWLEISVWVMGNTPKILEAGAPGFFYKIKKKSRKNNDIYNRVHGSSIQSIISPLINGSCNAMPSANETLLHWYFTHDWQWSYSSDESSTEAFFPQEKQDKMHWFYCLISKLIEGNNKQCISNATFILHTYFTDKKLSYLTV